MVACLHNTNIDENNELPDYWFYFFFNFIDLRRQTCYLSSSSGFCTNGMSQTTKRDQCCCSIGVAWGSDCEACPRQGTREYCMCTYRITPWNWNVLGTCPECHKQSTYVWNATDFCVWGAYFVLGFWALAFWHWRFAPKIKPPESSIEGQEGFFWYAMMLGVQQYTPKNINF